MLCACGLGLIRTPESASHHSAPSTLHSLTNFRPAPHDSNLGYVT